MKQKSWEFYVDLGYSKPTAKSRAILDPIVEYAEGHPGSGSLVPWSIRLTEEGTRALNMNGQYICSIASLHDAARRYLEFLEKTK